MNVSRTVASAKVTRVCASRLYLPKMGGAGGVRLPLLLAMWLLVARVRRSVATYASNVAWGLPRCW